MANSPNRMLELDVFRGMAALAVVLFHYTLRFDELYGHSPASPLHFLPGQYGVNLFFMISGFVIFMTLEKTQNWMDFVVSRFSRLYPAYWTAIVLTFLVVAIAGLPGREVTVSQAAINLSMVQSFFFVPDVDGVYWTLKLELAFYVIMFILWRAGLFRSIEKVAMGWLVLQVGIYAAEKAMHLVVPDRIGTILLLGHAHLFVAGIIFYLISKNGPSLTRYGIIFACVGVNFILYDIQSSVATLGFVGLFYLAVSGRLRWLAIPPLIFLGTISYTLYLTHQNIGYIMLRTLEAAGVPVPASIFAAIVVSLGIATTITYLIEKPAMNRIRYWYKKANNQLRVENEQT